MPQRCASAEANLAVSVLPAKHGRTDLATPLIHPDSCQEWVIWPADAACGLISSYGLEVPNELENAAMSQSCYGHDFNSTTTNNCQAIGQVSSICIRTGSSVPQLGLHYARVLIMREANFLTQPVQVSHPPDGKLLARCYALRAMSPLSHVASFMICLTSIFRSQQQDMLISMYATVWPMLFQSVPGKRCEDVWCRCQSMLGGSNVTVLLVADIGRVML